MSYGIGVDIGGTRVKAVCVTRDGEVLQRTTFDTGEATDAWAAGVKERIASIERERGPADAVGMSSPGLAARDGRTIAWMRGRMAGVEGFDWTAHLGRGAAVPVLNDAQAALLGEAWVGAAAGAGNAVMLTLGTGVGGAILCDGRLLRGHLGRAGHLGHLTVDVDGPRDIVRTPGSLEDAIGDHTVSARSAGRFGDTRALVEAYGAGDAVAQRVWLRSVWALACGIAGVINAVDPEVVVIGGGIAGAGEALFPPLNAYLDEVEWRPTGGAVRVVPAALADYAGAIGAARRAITGGER